jgi:hypothetical protein
MAKKALYVFMSSLLGILLFFILQRVGVFIYLYLLAAGYIDSFTNFDKFLVVDYLTLSFAFVAGGWYGAWLGLFWFEKVYVENSHGGLVRHISDNFFTLGRPKSIPAKMVAVKRRLETDLWELESLAKSSTAENKSSQPKIRRVVRKRAPKKLSPAKP